MKPKTVYLVDKPVAAGLGLGINVADETIETTFCWLVETPQIRKEMQSLMMRHDLKSGIKRVIGLILEDED